MRVTATDAAGASTHDDFTLTVANTNDAPTLVVVLAQQQAVRRQAFAFDIDAAAFVDVDAGDTLTYTAALADGAPLPDWIGFNATTLRFAGSGIGAAVGTTRLAVTATDRAGASVSGIFNLEVARGNEAPVAVVDGASINEDDQAAVSGNVLANDSDADGDPLTLLDPGIRVGAYGALTVGADGAYSYSLDNGAAAVQSLGAGMNLSERFSYSVGDGIASVSAMLEVTIHGRNDAPVARMPLSAQAGRELETLNFSLPGDAFTDIDGGDSLTYRASLLDAAGAQAALPSWLTFNPLTRSFSATPGAADGGSYRLRIEAADCALATAGSTFTLTIADQGAGSDGAISGGASGDLINGTDADETLDGKGGADRLMGGAGNDTLVYSNDAQWLPSSGLIAYNTNSGEVVGLTGRMRSFDIFDGGSGSDILLGSAQGDALFLDDGFSPAQSTGPRIAAIEIIRAGAGNDLVDLTSNRYVLGDMVIEGGTGNDILWSSNGHDLVQGEAGADRLEGGGGNDVNQGGDGDDVIGDRFGRNVYDGGAGNDNLRGSDSAGFFLGGRGNDALSLGRGADVVAFSRGDGQDGVASTRETVANDTLSLGGGIRATDLALRKSGNDLQVETDATGADRLTLRDWYAPLANRSYINLQVVNQALADFDSGAVDPLRDQRVERFDFAGLVGRFDAERAATPTLGRWEVANALAMFHLGGSDTQAIGGDLSLQAGLNGSLANMRLGTAQGTLANADFGAREQAFGATANLTNSMFKLT